MSNAAMFDSVPIGLVFLLTLTLIVMSVEIGYRVGIIRARKYEREREAPIDAMVGSTLGLLAFMLAFTFGMATSRYDARKQLVVDEANAIRTADLRAQLLPEPARSSIRAVLREYVEVRLDAVSHPNQFAKDLKRSEELHATLWSHIAPLGDVPPPERVALASAFVEMINIHTKRVNAVTNNRIYGAIWVALYSVAVLAMGILGYRGGLAGKRSPIAILALAMSFSAVLMLINDLDRPQQGLVEVSQQTLTDLQTKFRLPTSEDAR